MNSHFDPFDTLRDAIPDTSPNPSQTRQARDALQAAIASESQSSLEPSRVRVMPRVAIAFVVFVFAVVSLSLVVSRDNSAIATLQEIAQAASQAKPADIPEGGFLFRESLERDIRIVPGSELGLDREFAVYSLETERSIWRNPEARFVQMRSVNRAPVFYDEEVAQGYVNEAIADADALGQPVIEQFTKVIDPLLETPWSESLDQLRGQIVDLIGGTDAADTPSHVIFDFAIDMLAEPITPEIRGAVAELLATLDLTDVTRNTDGTVRIRIEHGDEPLMQQIVVLRDDGTLQSRDIVLLEEDPELGLPAGTVTSSATYSRWVEVTEIEP